MTLLLLCPCMSLSLSFPKCDYSNTPKKNKPLTKLKPSKNSCKFAILGGAHFAFRSRNGKFDGFSVNNNNSSQSEHETLELLTKPSLVPLTNGSSSEFDEDKEKALEPILKFFKGSESDSPEVKGDGGVLEDSEEMGHKGCGDGENEEEEEEEANEKVSAIGEYYYEPKPGDFVVGVVVGGNENRLSVKVGAELPGTMLTKEVLPLYGKELEHLFCGGDGNNNNKEEEDFMVQGRMGIAMSNDDDDNGGDAMNGGMGVPAEEGSSSVVEIGTVLFAEVLGRTLTGRPLLSSRRLFRRIAWHRLRQIKQRKEPIKVRIIEWNTKGLLTRIEGLRAFLPKAELVKRVHSFTELKENVGRYMYVQITEVDEAKNNLILSEKEAWEKLYLQEGTLLEGTVKKILPYGAQIRIGETNRSGLLHVSNITRAEITSVSDILFVDEKVKVLVVKSAFPDKISLSTADLESEPGLFLSNKERVFLEADMMAKKYKEKLPPASITQQQPESLSNSSALPFENEEALYANWKWFKFSDQKKKSGSSLRNSNNEANNLMEA